MKADRDIAIRIEGLGKRYRLGENHDFRTLRDTVAALFKRRRASAPAGPTREIWAIRDLSLQVARGEVLGIIGRNGSGKSTLLKLLTRITQPDTGSIEIEGRVGALLEVGTGFHPELSGRENIYMNGSILGMRRSEIDKKFDEIVAFSGVETFLDTPVKRYSSGMRVRLGFAVAAHLDPEILVVDEVLAVGDAEFQRKCLGRMNAVAREGRTVLFVSHQMEAIQSLCTRAIWLEGGSLKGEGESGEIVTRYLADTELTIAATPLEDRVDRSGEGTLRLMSVTANDTAAGPLRTGAAAVFRFTIRSSKGISGISRLMLRLPVRDHMDRLVTFLSNELTGEDIVIDADATAAEISCSIDRLPLVPGSYVADVALWAGGRLEDKIMRVVAFEVLPGDYFGAGRSIHVGSFHVAQAWHRSS